MKPRRKENSSGSALSFERIKGLVELVTERGLSTLEVEQKGFRIRIEGARRPPGTVAVMAEGLHVITSPIAGTFYRAPSPEAVAFAQVGQNVARGKILCIIESMSLMHEIESDVAGEIAEIYPGSGQRVEQGQNLFGIREIGNRNPA